MTFSGAFIAIMVVVSCVCGFSRNGRNTGRMLVINLAVIAIVTAVLLMLWSVGVTPTIVSLRTDQDFTNSQAFGVNIFAFSVPLFYLMISAVVRMFVHRSV